MERDLIFCLQGVQIGLVESRTFIEAGLSWSRGEAQNLREEIIRRAQINEENVALLDKSVEIILKRHGVEEPKPLQAPGEGKQVFESLGGAPVQGERETFLPMPERLAALWRATRSWAGSGPEAGRHVTGSS